MPSDVDVANIALENIGARFLVSSLSPPLPAPNAAVVARRYQSVVDALFRAAHWNCARVQSPNLSLLRAAMGTPENPSGTLPQPPPPWQYEYTLPPDCLKARTLIPNPPQQGQTAPAVLAAGFLPTPWFLPEAGWQFAVGVNTDTSGNRVKVLWTNLEYAQLVYTARITDPNLWDAHFFTAAHASLGAWLVNPINRNAQILKEQVEIATGIILQARVSDGNEGTQSIDHTPDWMAVRGFTGRGLLSGGMWYGPWDTMGFPGGVLV